MMKCEPVVGLDGIRSIRLFTMSIRRPMAFGQKGKKKLTRKKSFQLLGCDGRKAFKNRKFHSVFGENWGASIDPEWRHHSQTRLGVTYEFRNGARDPEITWDLMNFSNVSNDRLRIARNILKRILFEFESQCQYWCCFEVRDCSQTVDERCNSMPFKSILIN